MTVTVNEQVAVFPLPSVAVAVTVVVPKTKEEPEAGLNEIVAVPQLSEAVATKVTEALQTPAPAFTTIFEGQVTVGGVLSTPLPTVAEAVAVVPQPSVTVTL